MTHPLILAALAMPATHVVLTRYESGHVRRHETRNAASAENFATGERRRIGRELISRENGATVRIVAVDVLTLAEERERLAAEYAACIGYDPFADDPEATSAEVSQTLNEWHKESRNA